MQVATLQSKQIGVPDAADDIPLVSAALADHLIGDAAALFLIHATEECDPAAGFRRFLPGRLRHLLCPGQIVHTVADHPDLLRQLRVHPGVNLPGRSRGRDQHIAKRKRFPTFFPPGRDIIGLLGVGQLLAQARGTMLGISAAIAAAIQEQFDGGADVVIVMKGQQQRQPHVLGQGEYIEAQSLHMVHMDQVDGKRG